MKTNNYLLLAFCTFIFLNITGIAGCKKESLQSTSIEIADASTLSTDSIDLKKGLVAWYPFNGNAKDSSGNGNNVIFNSAKRCKGKNGIASNAYLFDGSSSYMMVANSGSLNPTNAITLYALIKPKGFYMGICHSSRIVDKGYEDEANGGYNIGFDDAPYYNFNECYEVVQTRYENFYSTYGDGRSAGHGIGAYDYADNIQLNTWYKVAFTFNGSKAKIYVNGILKNTATGSATFTPNTNSLYIGRLESSTFPYYFNGIIDEIKIYKRALTSLEVAAL